MLNNCYTHQCVFVTCVANPMAGDPCVFGAKSLIMGIKTALPKYEVYFYMSVLGLAVAWAASWIVEASGGEY